ncbi:MAG: glycosyltransferase family 2 protein [Pseudomonadota bacterium]
MSSTEQNIEVSAVMPCLNEEQTLAACIEKAINCFAALGIRGEVVVGDNGSTDRSREIAESLGARVVNQPVRGYGAALQAAIAASRGRYCIMADSDDSYDWSSMGPFVEKLREGYDLVMGTRLKGTILPGAMPPLHRYFGNPLLSGIMNIFFRTGVSDAHCGMRGFSKESYEKLNLQATGMEFATEMVVKAKNRDLKITEIPITLHRDGRSCAPHLRSFRDGWRHLRLLLFYAPDYLYLIPGFLLFIPGIMLQALLLLGPTVIFGFYLGIHWLALGCLMSLLGFQILSLGAFAKTFAMSDQFEMRGPFFGRMLGWFTLEAGVAGGAVMVFLGLLADLSILVTWLSRGMGYLGSTHTVFVATTVIALGFQVVFSSFFLAMCKLSGSNGQEWNCETDSPED